MSIEGKTPRGAQDEQAGAAAPSGSLVRGALRWTALGLLAIVLLLAALVSWVANTQQGTSWAAGLASRALGERLSFRTVQGSLSGPLTLEQLRYVDPDSGLEVSIDRVLLDLELLALLRRTVQLRNAEVQGLRVLLGAASEPESEPKPFSIEPPIDVVVDRFFLGDATVMQDEASLIDIERAELIGRWLRSGIELERLEVVAAQGELHFNGRVAHAGHYAGEGHGRFRWRSGEQLFAGELQALTQGERADVVLQLSSPLRAQLDASLTQSDELPWQFVLEVPSFDPRQALMPDSSLRTIAASLRGAGSLRSRVGGAQMLVAGEATGEIVLDGLPIHIEPLRFTRSSERITLDPLTIKLGPDPLQPGADGNEGQSAGDAAGTLTARGEVLLAQQPLQASIDLNWQELVIPARLAGQTLHTQGALQVQGSLDSYAAHGQMSIGPERKPVNITLDIDGTPASVQVNRLTLVQAAGEMSAHGQVDLEPRIAWRLESRARQFDPGAFVAGWPGQVNFDLNTAGQLGEHGPDGTFELRDLRGSLRGRPIAGRADLAFTGQSSIAGTLALRSGASRIELRAREGDELNVLVTAEVDTLDDWLPGAQGRLQARATARGSWPELDVALTAQGQALRLADASVEALEVELALSNPQQPSGTGRIELTDADAAGFRFATVRAQAAGDRAAHDLALSASGEQLGAELRLTGAQTEGGWSGLIEQLQFDIPQVAQLALQAPVQLVLADGALALQQACLAGGDIRLCAALDRQADGALQASYTLQGVPLGLANVFLPQLPVTASGMIEGSGDLRRTAAGELHGRASIELPAGRIASAQMPDDSLMDYSELRFLADLAGADARATLTGRLGDGGKLDGIISLSGLEQEQTRIDGEVSASIPSLTAIALFVPQLAEVEGRADLQAKVAGTLEAPEVSGALEVTEFATQIPEIGLKLTDGRFRVRPEADGQIGLDGEVRSGKGSLSFDGRMTRDGQVRATLKGTDFLVADIPAAHVIAAPDLTFVRDEQRMSLTGEVRVPSADVDLTKLPAAGPQRASSDVVVVDEQSVAQDEQAMPLHANIRVILGDDVKLAGFGLEASVGGQLAITEQPGAPTAASGDIRVAGTYKAYGQDLTIQRGQLLFANTPLDDPGLSIVAVRKVEQITAGLRVEGTARAPQLSVFSDPSMTQSEALSYLVTGRPLDEVGSGEGDGDALQAAARSLGTAGGGMLAKSIGGRLGVDDVGVESSDMLGGAALTVGQYLSPRLYLSYGVGLFEPGEVITLRYRLSKELALQTARGPSETRAGIEYRIEK